MHQTLYSAVRVITEALCSPSEPFNILCLCRSKAFSLDTSEHSPQNLKAKQGGKNKVSSMIEGEREGNRAQHYKILGMI